jgi:hypothetical protein
MSRKFWEALEKDPERDLIVPELSALRTWLVANQIAHVGMSARETSSVRPQIGVVISHLISLPNLIPSRYLVDSHAKTMSEVDGMLWKVGERGHANTSPAVTNQFAQG